MSYFLWDKVICAWNTLGIRYNKLSQVASPSEELAEHFGNLQLSVMNVELLRITVHPTPVAGKRSHSQEISVGCA